MIVPASIVKIRKWIEVCEKAGLEIPDEIIMLDTYATFLESVILNREIKEQFADARKN